MKVVQVSVSDIKGGAAIAAFRLHQGLRQTGLESSMLVAEKYGRGDDNVVVSPDRIGYFSRRLHYRQLSARFWRHAGSRPAGLSPFTGPGARRNRKLVKRLSAADIINLHWIANFVDLPTILARSAQPLVWTLHDMNAFTGGCHLTLDCEKYRKQCGACPQLGSKSDRDVSREIWRIKHEIFQFAASGKLHLVAPSTWLAKQVERSSLLGNMPLSVIPNALDITVFKPYDKFSAREQLGIPATTRVLLFTADVIDSQHKGLQYLLDALLGIDQSSDILLVTLGAGKTKPDTELPVLGLGHLKDDRQIALAYSAADLFIIPSVQDNLPNTVMEAMACGTPVVGFDVGGIADMVRAGITGLLAPARDVRQLRQAITDLLGNLPLRTEMAGNCRRITLSDYSLSVQAGRYIDLYQQLLDQQAASC